MRLGKDRVPVLGLGSLVEAECRAKERSSGGSLGWAAILEWSWMVARRVK